MSRLLQRGLRLVRSGRVILLFVALSAPVAIVFASGAGAQDKPPAIDRPMMPRPEGQSPGALMGAAPGAQMPGADPFQLLENSAEVQKDMDLTKDQLSRLNRASRNFRTKLQDLSSPSQGGSDASKVEIERHVLDTRGMIARELTPAQLARLQQIMLQLEGPCLAIIDKPMGEQLGLTTQQNQAVARACETRSLQMRQAFRPEGPAGSFCGQMAENRDRIEEVRSRADQQILTLLSVPQKEKFLRMSGKKLQLSAPMPPECN